MSIKFLSLRRIGPNFVVLLLPLVIITGVVILFVVTVKLGYDNVSKQIAAYEESVADERVLSDKYTALRNVNTQVLDSTDKVLIALPPKSPVAWVISQVKVSASENETTISKLDVDNMQEQESGLISMNLTFEGETKDSATFYTFMSTIVGMAPVTTFNEIHVERVQDSEKYLFNAELVFYWSPLPETLPELTEPLKELSTYDRDILGKLLGLREPEFLSLEPSEPTERETPFN